MGCKYTTKFLIYKRFSRILNKKKLHNDGKCFYSALIAHLHIRTWLGQYLFYSDYAVHHIFLHSAPWKSSQIFFIVEFDIPATASHQ